MGKYWYKKKKKGGKKRGYWRRRRGFRKKASLSLGTLIPDRTLVRLKYATDQNLLVPSLATGPNLGYAIFACNDVFDPEYATGGHQPMGYDELKTFYRRFTVLGCRIQAVFRADNETTLASNLLTGMTNCGISVISQDNSGNAEIIPRITEIMENGSTTFGAIHPHRPLLTLKKKWSAKRFFGIKDVQDNPNLSGLNDPSLLGTGSPKTKAFFQVSCWQPRGETVGSVARYVPLTVTLSYIVMLRERERIPGS